ncbi:MAG: hypothetical protein HXS54_05715 [Theionarchaea archaeon]|nr:hypothetical protein [Theionarchaea archaeon]
MFIKEVKIIRISLKEKRKHYRAIYDAVFDTPRIKPSDIASLLKIDRSAASRRMIEAFTLCYISKPHIRLRSFKNFKEYVYFVCCEKPLELFLKYRDDPRVLYHSVISGFANLWIVTKEPINIEGKIVVEGYRSDYFSPLAPYHSWEKATHNMQSKIRTFDREQYEPEGLIKTHWDETVKWNSEYETLYREFRYDLRKSLTPIFKKHHIPWRTLYNWFEKLPGFCSIHTNYYPESISMYHAYLFMFQTDYEDFIINLFSELPTSCLFFKVSNGLLLFVHLKNEFLAVADPWKPDITVLQIPILIHDLLKKGIIKGETHAMAEYYCQKY